MLFNKDIDSYLIDFLTILQMGVYLKLCKSCNLLFKKTKYYLELKLCKSYSFNNICIFGDTNLVKKALLEFKYDAIDLYRILIEKCKRGQLNAVKFLIEKGADYEPSDDSIIVSIRFGHLELVKFLVERKLKCKENYIIIQTAAGHGYLEIVKFLVGKGINFRDKNDLSFRCACVNGHLAVVKFLLVYGIDCRTCNDYSICEASKNGHLEVVKFLVNQGANISKAIQFATENGQLEIVTFLTKKCKRYKL